MRKLIENATKKEQSRTRKITSISCIVEGFSFEGCHLTTRMEMSLLLQLIVSVVSSSTTAASKRDRSVASLPG